VVTEQDAQDVVEIIKESLYVPFTASHCTTLAPRSTMPASQSTMPASDSTVTASHYPLPRYDLFTDEIGHVDFRKGKGSKLGKSKQIKLFMERVVQILLTLLRFLTLLTLLTLPTLLYDPANPTNPRVRSANESGSASCRTSRSFITRRFPHLLSYVPSRLTPRSPSHPSILPQLYAISNALNLGVERFDLFLDTLNQQNYLILKGNRNYQITTA
jgi:hypothetical protein